jgi:transcriptional regulator of acetoin/glycerol metabolism
VPQTFSAQIAGTNFMVAYSDENRLVLDTIYDKTCLQTDVGKTVVPGSIWAENVCGTNGLGLSVELKKPTISATNIFSPNCWN